jgi:hypothetical protein
MFERIEPIGEAARVDDLVVELRRAVEIVVVVIQPGRLELVRLRGAEHAERRAGFHAERAHRADHCGDLVDVAILRRAPGRAHAEARRPGRLGRARLVEHGVERHQFFGLDAGCVARGLGTVSAVFGAAAGLDRQQCGNLYRVRVVMAAMHRLRARDQVAERRGQQGQHLGARPVMAPSGPLLILNDAIPIELTRVDSILVGCELVAVEGSDRGHDGAHMA